MSPKIKVRIPDSERVRVDVLIARKLSRAQSKGRSLGLAVMNLSVALSALKATKAREAKLAKETKS